MTTHNSTYVSVSPVRLSPLGTHSGVDITIQNLSDTDPVYLGGPNNLNSENFGYLLAPGAAWSVELSGQDAIYAVSYPGAYVAVLMTSLEAGY
jgi:hypothetical protein